MLLNSFFLSYNGGERRVIIVHQLHERDSESEIFALLNEKAPLSITQIAEELKITRSVCMHRLKALLESGKIVQMRASNSGKSYYIVNKQATVADIGNMHIEIAKETVEAKDAYGELVDKVEKIDSNVNGIYANIISIMSIFVCIFALITVNANISFELTQENMQNVFKGIVVVNISVVVCIVALLVGVKLILIKPLEAKRKNKLSE